MKRLKEYLTISNLLYTGSIVFALGVLLKTYLERLQLPAGVCPIDSNRPLLYTALIILIGVNVGIAVYNWKKRKGSS